MSKINFKPKGSDVVDYDYQRQITAGPNVWYKAVCLKSKLVLAKSSGKPMLQFSFGIDGDQGGVRCDYRVMNPEEGSSFRSRAFNALGYARVDKEGVPFDSDEFVGLEVMCRPRIGENQFKEPRVEISDLKAIVDENTPTRRYTPSPKKDEVEGDDDVPFQVPQQ